jgi:hypothetical protein
MFLVFAANYSSGDRQIVSFETATEALDSSKVSPTSASSTGRFPLLVAKCSIGESNLFIF